MNIYHIYLNNTHLVTYPVLGISLLIGLYLLRHHPPPIAFTIASLYMALTTTLGAVAFNIFAIKWRPTIPFWAALSVIITCMLIIINKYYPHTKISNNFYKTLTLFLLTTLWLHFSGFYAQVSWWADYGGIDPHNTMWFINRILVFSIWPFLIKPKSL